MSSFRSYVSPWSKSSYSTPTSSSSYLRGNTGGSSTSLLSSSASNKDDKPYSSTGSYSRSRYGSSAIEKSSGDTGDGGGSTTGSSRDGGTTSSTTSGYRSSTLSSSTPSKSTATSRTSYRSPYSTSTLGSGSSTSGVGGGGAKDRSSSQDRLGYLSSVTSARGRATSPEPDDSTSKNASSLSSSYSSRPSTLRPISISRATSLRSRYKDEPDYNSPTSPSTAPAGLLRSPRADITPFKWTGRYSSSSSAGLRSPVGDVSPTVFGVSPEVKREEGKAADGEPSAPVKEEEKKEGDGKGEKKEENESGKPETISVVTRGTSPNPPTTYVRIRRYELAWQIQKEVPKPPKRESVDAEVQTDKVEEENTHSSRYSRLSSPSSRLSTSPWYMDRYSSGSSSYVPRTYSRYGSTPSPSVSKRPSPVRSSSGSIANSTNDSGAPDNEKDNSSSSKESSASAPKSEGTRSRDTKTPTLDKNPSKDDVKIESSKTDSKSSEETKTPSCKKSSQKSTEEPKTESKSSDSAKSSKLTEDSKTPPWKKAMQKNSEEAKTDNKSSELSKSKSSEDSKTMPPLKSISKSSEDAKSSKSESTSSDDPKIPAWKAALKQSLEAKAASQNSSQKTSEDSKASLSKAETKTSEEIKTPSKSQSKSIEDSKSASEASKTSATKSEPKSSDEPKAPPGKSITKSTEELKSDSKANKIQTSKSETKSSEDAQVSNSSTAPKTPPWKAAIKTAEDAKKTKNTSSVSEASDSVSSKVSEGKTTENLTSALKETLRSDESIYPMTTEKEKETTSAPSITNKARPSSACSSASSSPSRGRERSPSAGRGTSRPPSVPTSAPSSRAGSSERTDPTSSSSRTSAGVKSLSSYSSNQDLSSSQKKLPSPRPPPSPRPIQRSNSAANLQGVANKDFRKSSLNMAEEPAKSEPIETHKRVIKKKTTRSRTLGGSDLSIPREPLSRSQLTLPLKPPPVGGKLVIPIALVQSDDDETSASSVDEDEDEEEMLENKFVGGGTAAKPPIPKKEGPAEDLKSKPRVRRRGETGSWREAYKVEEDGGKKKGGSQSEASGEDSSGADRNRLKINKIKRQPSGELPWWIEGSKEAPPEGVIIRVDSSKDLAIEKSTDDLDKDSESGGERRTLKLFRITREPSGELAWWLDESQPVPEGVVVKVPSTLNVPDMTSAEVDNKSASESSSDKKKPFKLMRDPSGDIPWWADGSKEAPPEGVIIRVDSSKDLATEKSAEDSSKDSDYGSGRKTLKLFKISRDPSGELPWWLDSNQAAPEGVIVKAPSSVNIAETTSADASKNSTSESSRGKKKPFKLARDPSGEIAWWMDGSGEVPEGVIRMESSSSLASKGSSEDAKKNSGSNSASEKGKPIKPFKNKSGERAWWMEGSNEPLPDGIILIETTPSGSSASKSSEDKKPEKRKIMKITRQPTGELAWWMDDSKPVPEGVTRIESSHSIASKPDSSDEGSKSSGIRTGKLIPIWRQPSGERAWWMEGGDSAAPEGVERVESSPSAAGSHGETGKLSRADSQEEGSGKSAGTRRRVWRVESGERAWWMEGNDASVPEGVQKIESTHGLGSVGAEVAKKAVAAKKGSAGASSSSESESESESSSSEEEVEDDMPMEGSSDEEEGEGEKKKREKEAVNGGIPRPELGVRTSPDGVEEVVGPEKAGRTTAGGVDVDKEEEEEEEDEKEVMRRQKERARRNLRYFIGRHTNIDDLLGGDVAAPGDSVAAMVAAVEASQRSSGRGVKIEKYDGVGSEDESSSPVEEVDPSQVRIHDSTAQTPTLLQQQTVTEGTGSEHTAGRPPPPPPPPPGAKLDDVALQVYKDGDYGAYLDLEASISEQPEEFEGFQSNRKNSIVLRTQLSVRVHAVIEKLLNSEGRELRRALFSLKQIFQEDKDLVHEFVQNEGLACLIKVGSEADQNYQNYILRALGQVMLYVDGMNGVMAHNQTVQWLYSLIASRFRLVVKTALKLLLVFAEYVESNCFLLIRAVLTVDKAQGLPPWSNIMRLLKDYDTADTELLIYAMTLINRTLNGIPDQDTYYDQVDALEEQGMESVVQRYMSKQGTDLDLLRQFQIYEAVLHHEDGEEKGAPLKQLDETIRKTLRNRKSLADSDSSERRKSRRHSTGTSPMSQSLVRQRHCNGHANLRLKPPYPGHEEEGEGEEESSSGSSHSPSPPATGTPTSPLNNHMQFNSGTQNKVNDNVGVTPALRRRRERAERQRSFIREQQESGATLRASLGQTEDGKSERIENGNIATNGHHDSSAPWSQRLHKDANCNVESSGAEEGEGGDRAAVRRIRRENTVRDLTQKLASQGGLLASPTEERVPRDIGDMSGIVSKAKEGLARSKSKADLRSPTDSTSSGRGGTQPEIKKSETELHWEELLNNSTRPLTLCDLDFTDLMEEDDVDVLSPALPTQGGLLPPPPPPPCVPMPPPPSTRVPPAPPPVGGGFGRMPPPPPIGYSRPGLNPPAPAPPSPATLKKSKKTVKLFWKEVREDPVVLSKLSGGMRSSSSASMIWDEIQPVSIDTQKLEHLFESRAKDLIGKEKQQELNKSKEIIVLDPKRSNAINIGMTKLPPPRSIKTAILKMDSAIVNREGIEKLLTMLPTEEERSRIQEAQSANPDVPLGSAEQFLLTLASISELSARLKLWAFKLDYENSEKEVAEPLMDLKQGMQTLRASKTFRSILSTLLSVGIFLNGSEVKGFQIEYLAKVPEVKDTVHKHSLLHHLCHIVMEKFPDSSDLYSEIGSITRASKVDFEELATSIQRMEQECKASWDHLKVIAKHDGSTMVKVKMSDFLADCAERIIVLGIVHRRVMNRFNKFLLWLGIPLHRVQDTKPNEFCKIISEFALEYRTTRERVLQQLEKKASHRERNKTRGKMITDVGKFRSKEDRADAELRQLLGSDFSEIDSIHGSLPWRRQRKDAGNTRSRGLTDILRGTNGNECLGDNMTDGDDEILESLVKTATKGPSTRTTPRERKRTRHADRKSLKRSRTRENNVCQFLAEAYNQ